MKYVKDVDEYIALSPKEEVQY